jgi:hypothetical protein
MATVRMRAALRFGIVFLPLSAAYTQPPPPGYAYAPPAYPAPKADPYAGVRDNGGYHCAVRVPSGVILEAIGPSKPISTGRSLALPALHAWVLLVDHINPPAAAHDAAVLVADLGGTQAVTDSHDALLT